MSTATSIEPADVERRRTEIARLYVRGYSHADIAEKLGIDRTTVCRHLAVAHQQLKAEMPAALDDMRFIRAQSIVAVAREAWEAWELSKRAAKTTKAKIKKGKPSPVPNGQPEPDEVTTEQQTKEQCGDPRFMEIIRGCDKDLRDLYGLDAPKQTQITGADGGPITLFGLLTALQSRPPRPPEVFEARPSNVIDVDSIESLILDPQFNPEQLPALEHEPELSDGPLDESAS